MRDMMPCIYEGIVASADDFGVSFQPINNSHVRRLCVLGWILHHALSAMIAQVAGTADIVVGGCLSVYSRHVLVILFPFRAFKSRSAVRWRSTKRKRATTKSICLRVWLYRAREILKKAPQPDARNGELTGTNATRELLPHLFV